MKKLLLASTVVSAMFVGTAQAEDFSGLSVGANLGFGIFSASFVDYDDNFDNEGLNGNQDLHTNLGVNAGWLFQSEGFVYGAELSYTAYGAESESAISYYGAGDLYRTTLDNAISLKAKAGVATGSNLVYIAAGPTLASAEFKVAEDSTSSDSFDQDILGLSIAMGVEHQFTDRLAIRFEGEYTAFENMDDVISNTYRYASDSITLLNLKAGVVYAF